MGKLAIITARGGSKRIPRKNIKPFLGKPIIAYSIEAALASGIFDEVMVSTDDQEIAAIAKKYGARVPFFRSQENSDDYSTTVDAILEVLKCYKDKGVSFDSACCIYPTAPFITSEILSKTYNTLSTGNYDSVFPVVKFGYPIQRSLKEQEGKISLVWKEFERSRSQDLEARYHDAGQFYWFDTQQLEESRTLMGNNTAFYEIDELRVQDIDTEIDWKLAELKYDLVTNQTT